MSAPAIAAMTRGDLDVAIAWAKAEGWNPGLDDADPFFAADPGGFLKASLSGETVATISVVAYGERYGFLGLYICRPDMRGRGIGLALWRAGMAQLGGRTVGLDGVVAQQGNYARSGFVLARRHIRFGGMSTAEAADDREIVPLGASRALVGDVVAFDRAVFAAPRETFLRRWLTPPGRRAVAFVEGGAVRGYGAIRACVEGYKIGPLFADDERIAERLFVNLAAPVRGSVIYLDVPEPNVRAVALASRHGLAPTFETARMYRGDAPREPVDRIFGVTTLELG